MRYIERYIRLHILFEDHADRINVPSRFAATKLIEGDEPMMNALRLSDNEKDMLEHIVTEMETETGTDREAALADMRYDFIERVCADTVIKTARIQGTRTKCKNRQRTYP